MRNFWARETAQAALVGAALTALLYFLLVSPLIEAQRLAAAAERDSMRAALAQLEDYHRGAGIDADGGERLAERQQRLIAALPEASAQGPFMGWVERTAHASGVTLEGIAPQPPEETDALLIQPVEITFRGNYFAVLDFLRAVQEGERAVQLGTLDLRADDAGLRCVLTLKTASMRAEEIKKP